MFLAWDFLKVLFIQLFNEDCVKTSYYPIEMCKKTEEKSFDSLKEEDLYLHSCRWFDFWFLNFIFSIQGLNQFSLKKKSSEQRCKELCSDLLHNFSQVDIQN